MRQALRRKRRWRLGLACLVMAAALPAGSVLAAPASRQEPAKGELRLTGKFIKKLVLERQGRDEPMVIESPDATILLPEGQYRWEKVTLGGDGLGSPTFVAESYRDSQWISIKKDKPATLEIGGPLKPELIAFRQGTKISLRHRLAGVDGHTYNPVNSNLHPKFTISQNGQPVGSDRITTEYG